MSDVRSLHTPTGAEERATEEISLPIEWVETNQLESGDDVSDNESVASESSEESEMEPFPDYLPKIEQLLDDIGLHDYSVESLQHGYSFQNCVYALISLKDETEEYILRAPVLTSQWDFEDDRYLPVLNDVALLNFLGNKLVVPRVKAYSAITQNSLEKPFMVQTRLPGRSLDGLWTGLDQDDKLAITDLFVDLLAKLEAITFDSAGRCKAPSALPTSMNDFGSAPALVLQPFDEGDEEFTKDPQALKDRAGPDLKALLTSLLNGWIMSDIRSETGNDAFRIPMLRGLLAILDVLDHEGAFASGPQPINLYHWDLEPRNIMVEKNDGAWRITGIIDWDSALAQSRPLTRKPPSWIWDFEDNDVTGYLDCDRHPIAPLTEGNMALKTRFDAKAAELLPGYLEDAYGTGRWLRRIWLFAHEQIQSTYILDLLEELLEDWAQRPKYNVAVAAPIPPLVPEIIVSSEPALETTAETEPELQTTTVPEDEKPKSVWKGSLDWLSLRVKALRQ